MTIVRSSALAALLVCAGGLIGLGYQKIFPPAIAQAGAEAPPAAAPGQRWEYCSLSKAAYPGSVRAGVYWITYYLDSGAKVLDQEDNATSNAALAKAIAKLGNEGWELVSIGPLEVRGTKVDAYYFKRPK